MVHALFVEPNFSNINKKGSVFEGDVRSSVPNLNQIIPQGKVINMTDVQKLKVLQHNRLIEGAAKMDTTSLKLFEIAVASIDLDLALNGDELEVSRSRTVRFSKEVIFNLIGIDGSSKYTRMKNQMGKMFEKAGFEVVTYDENGLGDFDYLAVKAISQMRWSVRDDFVEISFTPEIMPYLIDLKKNGLYTQYRLEDVAKMTNKYSIVLFKWLVMNFNQYNYYKEKKNRTNKQKNDYKNPHITIKELRRITDTENDYERFYDFERKVIKDSIKEINELTNLQVSYKKIKGGRYIKEIVFSIEEKPKKFVAPLTDETSAEVEMTREEREQQKQQELILASKARSSKYIDALTSYGTIFMRDVLNDKSMARVQTELIPLLEELEKRTSMAEVERHLKYTADHSQGVVDGVGYQITATKKYLSSNPFIDSDLSN